MSAPRPALARSIWFGPAEQPIFGWYHPPAAGTGRAVVICAPLGYEQVCSYRALRHMAEHLAASGVAVLRFDYAGTGDSAGDDEDSGRVSVWVDSIGTAVEQLRRMSGASRIGLVGLRLGATLAVTAAATLPGIDELVLWSPFPTGKAFLREFRALRAMADLPGGEPGDGPPLPAGDEEAAGFRISAGAIAELGQIDLTDGRSPGKGRVLYLRREDKTGNDPLPAAMEKSGATVSAEVVPGYATMMVDPHNSVVPEQVIDRVAQWFRESDPVTATPPRSSEPSGWASGTTASIGSGVLETAVRFGPEHRLFGILSEAEDASARQRTAVILLNPGAVHHIGSNRMYVRMARRWAGLGFTVLRMDIGGIGDSPPSPELPENHTYSPASVSDVRAALEFLKASRGCDRVALMGLCSGAHAAFHAALEQLPIVGVVLLNPITFYWKPGDLLDVSAWKNYTDVQHYQRSMVDWSRWKRVLRGEVNLWNPLTVAARRIGVVLSAWGRSALRSLGLVPPPQDDIGTDFKRMHDTGLGVLLVFSDGDPGLDYIRLHARRTVARLSRSDNFELKIIPKTDHTFTPVESQHRLQEILTSYLFSRYLDPATDPHGMNPPAAERRRTEMIGTTPGTRT